MANTRIELRQSGSTGNTPSLGVIANGELAINYADGILYYKTASNTLGSIRTTQPAGLTTEVQFNDAGSFGSNSGFTFSKTTGYFKAPIIESTNNGNGTNFKVGDDAWIGDVNLADTLRISGQQNSANAYIVFGATNANTLGRAGSGPLTYTGAFTATGTVSGNELTSTQSSGNEGGQVNLAIPASGTSLVGGVTIDVYQNQLRFFQGDSAKGAYIDLTAASAGVGTDLLNPSSTPDTLARTTANAAFDKANSANVLAQAAFNKANSVTQQGFVTITANGTNVVADANNDTLTLSSANGIGITANATTDAITINLNPTGVTSGTYGSASIVPVFVVDAQGRLSSVTNTAIAITSSAVSGTFGFASGGTNATSYTTGTLLTSNGTAIVSLANTGTAATYANATHVPVITTDAYGRVSAVTNTAISFPVTSVAGVTGAVSNTQLINGIIAVDGAGSGLDADLLDGLQGTSYANATFAQAAFDKANQTAQLAFTTVAANGTSLVADANNDTLTITANTANGIQILSNATTDTLDLGLKPSGVTAGVYGNTSTAVTITIDQFGRITSVSQTAISYSETDPLALAYAIALG